MSAGSLPGAGGGGGRHVESDFELNLAPIIDAFTVLIAFMIASASFLSIGILDAAVTAGGQEAQAGAENTLLLDVELRSDGAFSMRLEGGKGASQPEVIPSRDFDSFATRLADWKKREPGLKPTLAGAVYFPHVRFIRPDSFMAGLAQRCRGLGVQIIENAPVSAVRRAGDRVTAVVTPHGDVTGDQFLLAAGVHSGRLAGLFGRKLPIRPGKGYSIEYPEPPVKLTRAVNLSDAKVAVTPLDAGLRLAGTMEFAGLDTNVNQARIAAIKRAPVPYFTQWDAASNKHSAPWAGARPMTADCMPVIGRLAGTGNAWVAAGHEIGRAHV